VVGSVSSHPVDIAQLQHFGDQTVAPKQIDGTDEDESNQDNQTLGKMHRTRNLDRKFGSGSHYTRVLVSGDAGFETLLLTDVELRVLRTRALGNPEDCLEPSWADKLRAR
jgi:hypothetical protein